MTHDSHIFIVDDDAITRQLLRNMLASDGFTGLFDMPTGEAALEAAAERMPDLVLLDIQMPGMEGYDVCRAIRGLENGGDVPIVMITGADSETDTPLKASFDAGASDFISKPVRPLELLARVRSALSIKQARDRVKQELSRRIRAEQENAKIIAELQAALQTINTLNGLLPICASCKSIRDDSGYWSQLESYISAHSDVEFSHSICPECTERYLAELAAAKKKELDGQVQQRPTEKQQ